MTARILPKRLVGVLALVMLGLTSGAGQAGPITTTLINTPGLYDFVATSPGISGTVPVVNVTTTSATWASTIGIVEFSPATGTIFLSITWSLQPLVNSAGVVTSGGPMFTGFDTFFTGPGLIAPGGNPESKTLPFPGETDVNFFANLTFTNGTDPGGGYTFELRGEQAPVVPEPGSLTLLGIGAAGLGLFAYRRRKPQPA
jgi:hypothetical protein